MTTTSIAFQTSGDTILVRRGDKSALSPKMLIIGLTGGIGSGKSTVAEMLRRLGAVVINSDQVAHEAYLPHQNMWPQVVDAFGTDILGEGDVIDRRKLGALVFQDPAARHRLEEIVHPWTYQRVVELLAELAQQDAAVVVLEVPLLIEAGWDRLVDQVWVTYAPEEIVLQRLQQRDGMTPEQALARMRAQIPAEERLQRADVAIDTSGSVADVRAQVRQLWDEAVAAG